MPHLTLEYSSNTGSGLDSRQLFDTLHVQLAQAGGFRTQDFKSRVFPVDTFHIGKGNDSASFVRLNIETFSGKSTQQKQNLSQVALNVLSEHFHDALAHGNCDIAVQITELELESYARMRSNELEEKA
ncbi:5-carboxymethyl-2-hydroxymuconate isomerase [Pseudomonas sp. AA-38]|uniref:5-carboxymethyl-2-hydroxymuconate Delta-isomerase n=1 Tax=Pseudomonas sp. AA-38 TaxID=3028807 RepID=UPI0023F69B90|nr:5-carboxymethyl-2-hydroxymuconate isomerase [Pseudomonas sp. AA-38]